jgi:uncharacterized protein (TIGR03435 family)
MKFLLPFFLAFALSGQTFDVVSVKPNPTTPGIANSLIKIEPTSVTGRFVSLQNLIVKAYAVGPTHVEGGPSWIIMDRFDIDAKVQAPADDDQLRLMLQALLRDRFSLILRRDSRQVTAFALVVDRSGLKIFPPGDPRNAKLKEIMGARVPRTMPQFASLIGQAIDRPVADETSREGNFEVIMSHRPPSEASSDVVTNWQYLLEPMGLSLEPRGKVVQDFYTIVKASKPEPNQ